MKKIKFSIALNRKTKGEADFPWFVAYGKMAENIEQFFQKGRGIYIEYKLQTGSFTNKEGKKIYTEDKVLTDFEFPPIRKSEEQSVNDSEATESGQSASQEQTSEPPKAPDFNDIPDDLDGMELPFR
jgi:single-strand DNA-binding protein